eukprot:scaffold57704_cov63-Phaeocystis_antarctica.AAC.2
MLSAVALHSSSNVCTLCSTRSSARTALAQPIAADHRRPTPPPRRCALPGARALCATHIVEALRSSSVPVPAPMPPRLKLSTEKLVAAHTHAEVRTFCAASGAAFGSASGRAALSSSPPSELMRKRCSDGGNGWSGDRLLQPFVWRRGGGTALIPSDLISGDLAPLVVVDVLTLAWLELVGSSSSSSRRSLAVQVAASRSLAAAYGEARLDLRGERLELDREPLGRDRLNLAPDVRVGLEQPGERLARQGPQLDIGHGAAVAGGRLAREEGRLEYGGVGWVSRATRLARSNTVPQCWVPHNPGTTTTTSLLLHASPKKSPLVALRYTVLISAFHTWLGSGLGLGMG